MTIRAVSEREHARRKSRDTRKQKSDWMTAHLLFVEREAGRLGVDVLRSAEFAASREAFVKLMTILKTQKGK